MDNITIDREDYKVDSKKLKLQEPIFFNCTYQGSNDWNEISEPVFFYFLYLINQIYYRI